VFSDPGTDGSDTLTPTQRHNLTDLIEAAQIKALRIVLRAGDGLPCSELAEQLLADLDSAFAELKEYVRE
jgi:hypothetical protein